MTWCEKSCVGRAGQRVASGAKRFPKGWSPETRYPELMSVSESRKSDGHLETSAAIVGQSGAVAVRSGGQTARIVNEPFAHGGPFAHAEIFARGTRVPTAPAGGMLAPVLQPTSVPVPKNKKTPETKGRKIKKVHILAQKSIQNRSTSVPKVYFCAKTDQHLCQK